MEAVVGLLLMLLGVSQGVETFCDGRQDGSQCYGALGGTVVLQLMNDTSEIPRFDWKKESLNILRWRNYKMQSNEMQSRYVFISSNGTFRINNLNRKDSGGYRLDMFTINGTSTGNRTLQLTVQAPVSSVQLVSECLSQGEMKVSCSSEGGDSPQYSWTLDGRTLTHTELLSENTETNIITLKQNVSGRLVCSVRNHISSVSKEKNISTCGFIFINCSFNGTQIEKWVHKDNKTLCDEPTTVPTTVTTPGTHNTVGKETESHKTPINNTSTTQSPSLVNNFIMELLPVIGGVFAALVVLLVVGVAVMCTQKKKNKNQVEEADDQELTYADVRIVQKQKKQVEQREDLEVEYGQVRFSERPRQVESPADDCVYAKVRKGR